MRLFNTIFVLVISFTAFNSLAKSNDSIDTKLACYQYSSHISFLKQELSQAMFFVRSNSESSISSSLDKDEKALSSLLVRKQDLITKEQRLNLTKSDLLKQITDLMSKNSRNIASLKSGQKVTVENSDGLVQYLKIQVSRIDSLLTGVALELVIISKQIEKLQKSLSQANVENVQASQITKDRIAYFTQRSVEIQNEAAKLQKVISELCITSKN